MMRRAIRAVAISESLVTSSRTARGQRRLRAERAALHQAVEVYVLQLRDAGESADRALIDLRIVVRATPTFELELVARAQLLEQIVRWGSDAYYRIDGAVGAPVQPGSAERLVAECLGVLEQSGVHALLAWLNARTRFRFTAINRASAPAWQNLATFDRENPSILSSSGIQRTLLDNPLPFYCCAPVRASDGEAWGVLCHFDNRPRLVSERERLVLEWVAASLPIALLGEATTARPG